MIPYQQQLEELRLCLKEQYDEATADHIIFQIILNYFEENYYDN